jgi:hypothetical protein
MPYSRSKFLSLKIRRNCRVIQVRNSEDSCDHDKHFHAGRIGHNICRYAPGRHGGLTERPQARRHSEGNSKTFGSLEIRSLTFSDEPANVGCASQCPTYCKGRLSLSQDWIERRFN